MAVGITGYEDRKLIVSGSMIVSVLLHVVVGMIVLGVRWPAGGGGARSAVVDERVMVPEEKEEELTLGVDEARAASINWLGVQKQEAVEGEAEISETDQAAQTLVAGDSYEASQAAQEVSPEETAELVEDVKRAESVEAAQFETQEMQEAVEEMTVEIAEAVSESVTNTTREAVEGINALIEEVASALVIPEEVEGGDSVAISETEIPKVQESVNTAEALQEQKPQEKKTAAPTSEDRVVGAPGVLSDREVAATRIKKAIKVDPHTPNAPIVGKGLEILTVRPRYTSAVRLSAIPKNPIVVMWFNATGKVTRAEFVRDGKVLYSSGVIGVDEPLLNAIYQWRAKGAQIDGLDPKDPTDLVEVTIKILFQRERSESSD